MAASRAAMLAAGPDWEMLCRTMGRPRDLKPDLLFSDPSFPLMLLLNLLLEIARTCITIMKDPGLSGHQVGISDCKDNMLMEGAV